MMESNNSSTEYTTFERVLSLTIGILLLVTSLASIIANALLLAAICYDPYKCLRNVPIIFIANLAVADLLTGLAVDPLLAVYHFGVYQNKHYLKIQNVSHYIAFTTINNTVVTTVILIIDRNSWTINKNIKEQHCTNGMMESNNSSTEYTTFQRVLSLTIGILLLVISLATIIANALLLTAICYDPYKCFRNVPIVFVANLAVADLLTGLVVDPLYAVYHFGIYQNKYYSKTLEIGDYGSYITVNNAIVTIVILIIDRSVTIKKPFLYRRVMTLKSAAIIVAISWIYSGFFSSFRLMGMSDKVYILLNTHLHVTFSFLSLTLLFAFIYFNLKTKKRRRLKEVTSVEF
ncbi:muscarinic acetylcholine receptor M3-like [Dendronephthya gigantea]|uniref:muscarinic acetylcholine receptor M3-like n=1 Tax=Dendronephthya gigantea TaxID=151771 RepID=UPI00106C26F0|nr:muscarinic acetylcholine receptor M3-like [Dendronephthya gigantea]